MRASFLSLFLILAAGCASAPPAPPPITPDPIKPPGAWEMKVADAPAPPPAPVVEAKETDKPNVACNTKRSLFVLPKKSQ